MEIKIYAFYNKLLSAFGTNFQFDDHEDSKVVYNISRGLNARLALGTYQDLKYLSFYKLGTFNDETGEFVADKTLLLDIDRIIDEYECKKNSEGLKNGEQTTTSAD